MKIEIWNGMYKRRWRRDTLKHGIDHPAKYPPALAENVYSKATELQWITSGSKVLDPFAGVATGAKSAFEKDLFWEGIELDERFYKSALLNLAAWGDTKNYRMHCGSSVSMSRILGDRFGEFDLVFSSPPYASIRIGNKSGQDQVGHNDNYSNHGDQLGSMDDYTFWTRAETIIAECYAALKPTGRAVWVVKAYNRGNTLVEFPRMWMEACVRMGFRPVLMAKAMQVEFDENGKKKSYKSHWRKYNEEVRGLPAVDYEEVQFMEKIT